MTECYPLAAECDSGLGAFANGDPAIAASARR
jgi:hypothetical protein